MSYNDNSVVSIQVKNPLADKIVQTYVTFFNLPAEIEKMIKTNTMVDEDMAKFFGGNWKNKLFMNLTGGDDSSEEFDFDDEIEEIDVKTTQTLKFDGGVIRNTEITIFPHDTVFQLKQKIYAITGIPVYRQYIELANGDQFNYYDIIIQGNIPYMVDRIDDVTLVANVMIDSNLADESKSIKVRARDEQIMVRDTMFVGYVVTDLNFYRAEMNIEVLRNDKFQQKLIYYGLIKKYFPMINLPMFLNYLGDETTVFNKYPIMNTPVNVLTKRFHEEKRIEKVIYTQPKEIARIVSELDINTRKIEFTIYPAVSLRKSIYIRNILELIKIEGEVMAVIAKLGDYTFTKIAKMDKTSRYINYIEAIGDRDEEAIAILYRHEEIPDKINQLIINENAIIYGEFYATHINMSYEDVINTHKQYTNEYIAKLNKNVKIVMRPLFHTHQFKHIKYDERINIHRSEVSVICKKSLTLAQFLKLNPLFESYTDVGVFIKRDNIYMKDSETHLLKPYRGSRMVHDLIFTLKKDSELRDYYDIYREQSKMDIFRSRINQAKLDVKNGNTQIDFAFSDISSLSFANSLKYLAVLIFDLEAMDFKVIKKVSNLNPKKKMEELDPELFNFKVDGISYSRICQKKFRPIGVYTEEEYSNLTEKQIADRHLFIHQNMTNGEPIYYECPAKQPYFGYIVNKHPKGYCIPRCKETETEGAKNIQVKNICSTKFKVDDGEIESEENTNIIKFGKKLAPGRFSFLHESIYSSMRIKDKKSLLAYQTSETNIMYSLLEGFGYLLGFTIDQLLEDMIAKLTPEVHKQVTYDFNTKYEDIIISLKNIIDRVGDMADVLKVVSIIYTIYQTPIIIFDTSIFDDKEMLDSGNSQVEIELFNYVNFTNITNLRFFIMVRKSLLVITNNTNISAEYSPTVINMFNKFYNRQLRMNKKNKKFNEYFALEADDTISIIERTVSKNRIINVIAEYNGKHICVGVRNSIVTNTTPGIKDNYSHLIKDYKIDAKDTIEYVLSHGMSIDNLIFICYKKDIGVMLQADDKNKCRFIAFRIDDDYFWFTECSLEDLSLNDKIRIEFMNYNINEINTIIQKQLPVPYIADKDKNNMIYYKMNIYHLFRSEIYKILSGYKDAKLHKSMSAVVSKKNLYVNLINILPKSYQKVMRALDTNYDYNSYILQEDIDILFDTIAPIRKQVIESIIDQIGETIPKLINTEEKSSNIIVSEINVNSIKFGTLPDIKIELGLNKNKNIFYDSGKILLLKSLRKEMIAELVKEFGNKVRFIERIYTSDIYIVNNFFNVDLEPHEQILIRYN